MKTLYQTILFLVFSATISAQGEVLTNQTVIEMTRAGLSADIIAEKIRKTPGRFDVSAGALIALKDSDVDDQIISLMMERADSVLPGLVPRISEPKDYSENTEPDAAFPARTTEAPIPDPKEAIRSARTIAFHKSSAQPSRQNLEKTLLKNANFKRMNLTILRYKEEADIFVEIGFVSGSWITHRYVYRIFDRRSGAVLAAGETTSWGSLAENLARHISRSLVGLLD